MNITLITQGTRGDVQPYIALGKALVQAGHVVTVATAHAFADFVTQHGLGFVPLAGDPKEALAAFEKVTEGGSPLDNIRFIRSVLPRMGADMLTASEGTDLILSNFNVAHLAYSVAEKRRVPFINCGLVPMLATSSYPCPHIMPSAPRLWHSSLNRLTYIPIDQLVWQPFRSVINAFRVKTLNLAPYPFWGYSSVLTRHGVKRLEAYSAHVMPPAADWGDQVCVTGFWFMDDDPTWTPPAELCNFLTSGDRPIFIGFGSMNFGDSQQRMDIVLEALRRTGLRAVSTANWGAEYNDSQFLTVGHIPHNWLFRQVSAVIHHGGAGTTADAMRCGVPQFVVSFQGDQPFWGQRVAALGLGPGYVPRKKLTADILTDALQKLVLEGRYTQQAQGFSRCIESENGVAAAVEFIQRYQ